MAIIVVANLLADLSDLFSRHQPALYLFHPDFRQILQVGDPDGLFKQYTEMISTSSASCCNVMLSL